MIARRFAAVVVSVLLSGPAVLTAQTPPAPQRARTEVAVAPKLLDGYVGRYQIAPAVFLMVTREDSHLFVQLTDQGSFEVFADSNTTFFWKVVDAQITFETDAAGKATGVVLHQMGRDLKARRLEGEPVMPRQINLAAAIFDRYVGRYQLPAGVELSLARQGTRFLARMGAQEAIEIFPSSEREFFFKVVDAQLTFEVNGQGQAAAVVLHQDGHDRRAQRIE